MSTTQKSSLPRLKYHPNTERFLFEALRRTQRNLGRLEGGRSQSRGPRDVEAGDRDAADQRPGDQQAHISGPELLEGIREFALEEFGLMARTVFHCWSIHTTEDFGRVVFDLIERHEMSKTEGDQLSDFCDVYDFEEALDNQYRINVSRAFLVVPGLLSTVLMNTVFMNTVFMNTVLMNRGDILETGGLSATRAF